MITKRICPFCGSEEITFISKKEGFGVGKALAGGILLGPLGLLAGGIGANNAEMKCGCCKCGEVFDTELVITKQIAETPEEEIIVKKIEKDKAEKAEKAGNIMKVVIFGAVASILLMAAIFSVTI